MNSVLNQQPIAIDPAWMPDPEKAIRNYAGRAIYKFKLPGDRPGEFRVKFSRWEKSALKRKKKIPVSTWVERHRITPADSPFPGQVWQNETTPYLVGIMDAIDFESVQEVVVCAPEQTGKTDLSLNYLAYTADRRPGNWLIVYPDEKTAGDMSRDRVGPMFEDSPRLKKYLTGYVDDLSSLRINLRHMKIYMAWANSASRLKSRPLPYVLLDEIDEYPESVHKREGSPIDLARKRTRNFAHKRKILRVSTPTIETGPIWKALNNECEVVFVYFVKCPSCNAYQEMQFMTKKEDGELIYHIRWEGGSEADPRRIKADEKSTWYECAACGIRWDDAMRDEAVRQGQWRDREKGLSLELYLKSYKPVVIGFHYKAWISRFVSLRETAEAFLWGLKSLEGLKNFRKSYCAEPWRVLRQEREEDTILKLCDDRPRGRVPGGGKVASLTAGVDTQDHSFWYEIRAWAWGEDSLSRESWCIREGEVLSFEDLAQILFSDNYIDSDGNKYMVRLVIQDCLGHRTSEVYDFCRKNPGRIFPSIGRDRMAQPFSWSVQEYYPGKKKPIPGGLRLINVNTKYYKDELARLLAIAPGDPSCWWYHSEYHSRHAAHMVSEFVNDKGLWECPEHKPNHLWDCSVLNLVAADILGIKFWSRKAPAKKNTGGEPQEPPANRERIRDRGSYRPSWLNRR